MKEHKSKELISNLSDERLDELLVFVPAFSESSIANIEARYFEKISSIKKGIVPSDSVTKGRKFSIKKTALALAAAIMLLIMSTAALASMLDYDFGDIFSSFFRNPAAANVMEVNFSVESNGIKVTVLHAYTDGNEVYAMLEMKDLQGNRLSEDLRLIFDMNTLAHLATPISFDEATGKASMGIDINRQFAPVDIGDYLVFQLESILIGTDWHVHVPIDLPLHLHATQQEMITEEEWIIEAGSRGSRDGDMFYRPGQFLELGDSYKSIPGIDWAVLTNIGLYGDWLHVQTRRTSFWELDINWGMFSLVDISGTVFDERYSIFVGDYREIAFYIHDMDKLAGLSLAFSGPTVDKIIRGSWDFSFPITARAERKPFVVELQDSFYFRQISMQISPMNTSITLYSIDFGGFTATSSELFEHILSFDDPFITLADGSSITLITGGIMFSPDNAHFFFNSFYFDISQLHSITVLGIEHLLFAE